MPHEVQEAIKEIRMLLAEVRREREAMFGIVLASGDEATLKKWNAWIGCDAR